MGVFYQKSDDCVQASWQGPFFSRNNMSLDFLGRGKLILNPNSDDCVQASWQGPFFPEIKHTWIFRPISVISRFFENQKDAETHQKKSPLIFSP